MCKPVNADAESCAGGLSGTTHVHVSKEGIKGRLSKGPVWCSKQECCSMDRAKGMAPRMGAWHSSTDAGKIERLQVQVWWLVE